MGAYHLYHDGTATLHTVRSGVRVSGYFTAHGSLHSAERIDSLGRCQTRVSKALRADLERIEPIYRKHAAAKLPGEHGTRSLAL